MSKTREENLKLIRDSLSSMLEAEDHGLRDRQHEALLKLAESKGDELYQGYFNHSTGSGKTFQMATLIKAFRSANSNQKIIVLEESVEKVIDTAEDFTNPDKPEYLGENPEFIGKFNSNHKDADKPIIISTYASLKNLVKELDPNEVGLILPDEAHRCLSAMRRENLKSFSNSCIYGFTATPRYDDVRDLATLLENEIDTISIEDGIKQGLNCSMKNILLVSDIAVDLSQVKKDVTGDYNDAEFNKAIGAAHKEEIKDRIVEFWAKFTDEETGEKASNRITMINCRNLDEAKSQADAFNTYFGKTIAKAYGSTLSEKERDILRKEFKSGEFPVICQVNTLGEAYDHPALSLCINYPTSSIVREAQRGGRPLRLDPKDKTKKAWVVDVVFRHPDYIDAPITVAAEKNNQVLYAHIAGKLEINSKERDSVERILKNKREHQGVRSVETLNLHGFSIKSSTQDLFEISTATQKWEESNHIPEKTEWMLSSEKLMSIFIGAQDKIILKLKELQEERIQSGNKYIPMVIKAKNISTYGLFLNGTGNKEIDKQILYKFAKLSGLQRKDAFIEKTEYMKGSKDLTNIFISSQSTMIQKLKELKEENIQINNKKFPIIVKAKNGSGIGLFVNSTGDKEIDKQILYEFARLGRLQRRVAFIEKTEHMKGSKELTSIFIGSQSTIIQKLRELKEENVQLNNNDVPIVVEAKNGSGIGLFVNSTGDKEIDTQILDKFTELSGLQRKDAVDVKTEYMKGIKELTDMFIGSVHKVYSNVKELEGKVIQIDGEDIPLIVKVKNGSTFGLFLNGTDKEEIDKEILKRFAELSGLQRKNAVIEKTEYMKNVDDLMKIYIGDRKVVSTKIKEAYGEKVKIGNQEIPLIIEAKSRTSVSLILNGTGDKETDKEIMDKFTELSGLKPRQQDGQQITNTLINKRLNEGK